MTTHPDATFVLTLTCPDQRQIVHKVTGVLAKLDANIVESAQFGDGSTALFCMRISFAISSAPSQITALRTDIAQLAAQLEMNYSLNDMSELPRVLILVSKYDHCLTDLLYRQGRGDLPIDVRAVMSNHNDLQPLVARHDIPFHHAPVTRATKVAQEAQITELIAKEKIDFVVLARYMQILSSDFCAQFPGRIINIHHSFLPGFKGARPYHQAHERGVKIIGATAHYVTANLDEGPIIEQDVVRVSHSCDAKKLVVIGREIEQRVLARAVQFQAEHRVILNGKKTIVFG
ncbi:MAG: formyltetrahydrofolate deformylase [Polyangiales bacterium]|jgi:formyltetrahydrofolate deformylase